MFQSILFPQGKGINPRKEEEPDFFNDLNLDLVFAPLLEKKKEFQLEEFYYAPLHDPEVVAFRQEVAKELEDETLGPLFSDFSQALYSLARYMDIVRANLCSEGPGNNYLTRGRMLEYAGQYCTAVSKAAATLARHPLQSAGLGSLARYLSAYSTGEQFNGLCTRVRELKEKFARIRYCMLIKDGVIRVRKYEGQADQSQSITGAFARFRQGEVKDYRHKLPQEPYADHVEAAVLGLLARLYKETFAELESFCRQYADFDDSVLTRFAREIQFYLAWQDFLRPLREAGLPFHYPRLSSEPTAVEAADFFDLALAHEIKEKTVTNSFFLERPERIIVVTGPNQGGKTTFARAFGQLHYLASLGLSVPGRRSKLGLFRRIFTHFGREETASPLQGKLQDDLVRLRDLLGEAAEDSLIIVNEIFSSTTLADALGLGRHMMDAISALGSLAVVVTFLDEIASYGDNAVSMMSTVKAENPVVRTYKVVRKPPDGLAYALHLAEKHGLSYERLVRRLNP